MGVFRDFIRLHEPAQQAGLVEQFSRGLEAGEDLGAPRLRQVIDQVADAARFRRGNGNELPAARPASLFARDF